MINRVELFFEINLPHANSTKTQTQKEHIMCILRTLWGKILWPCLVVFAYLFAALVFSLGITLFVAIVITLGFAIGQGFDPSLPSESSPLVVWLGRTVFVTSFLGLSFFSLLHLWQERKRLNSYELNDNPGPGLG